MKSIEQAVAEGLKEAVGKPYDEAVLIIALKVREVIDEQRSFSPPMGMGLEEDQ